MDEVRRRKPMVLKSLRIFVLPIGLGVADGPAFQSFYQKGANSHATGSHLSLKSMAIWISR